MVYNALFKYLIFYCLIIFRFNLDMELNKIKKNAKYAPILLIFFAFFIIEFNTPFHSDDFSYAQLGGVEAHLKHYLGWSGRLVSDFFSTIILNIRIHFIISVIISLFSVAICYLLVAIPNKLFNKDFSSLNFILVSSLYWLFSPNLGQTNFWVVGACNYLVTTFFVALTLYLYICYKDSRSLFTYISLFFIALFAGCSNENLCLALIYTLVTIIVVYKYQNITFNHKLAIVVLSGVIIGSLVLLLAPGNYARLAHPAFASWRELTLFQKLSSHIHRSFDYVHFFKYLILFYIVDVLFLFLSKKEGYLKKILWSGLFLSSSLFALAVMIGSPYIPPRAYSGIFFFLLLAFSVSSDVSQFKDGLKKIHLMAQLCCFMLFIYSFSLMYLSYSVTKIQETLRNNHINYVKMVEGTSAETTIPSYYFIKLLKDRDMFDQFHSGAQATWFHVNKVNLQNVDYDYSIIKTGCELTVVNRSSLENVKVYYQPRGLLSSKSTIIVESTSKIPDDLKIGFMRDRGTELEEYSLSNPIKLMDRYYVGLTRMLPTVGSVTIMN